MLQRYFKNILKGLKRREKIYHKICEKSSLGFSSTNFFSKHWYMPSKIVTLLMLHNFYPNFGSEHGNFYSIFH